MANLKEVKNRIQSVGSTQQITSAMKMVAAAKLKRAQDKISQLRPYAQKLAGILKNVTAGLDGDVENKYGVERAVENVLIVAVTSDRGLCGAFNSNIFKATMALIEEKYAGVARSGGLYIFPVGKKAYDFFRKKDYQLVDDHWELFHDLNFDNAQSAAEQIMDGFAKGEFDRVELVFNEFKNIATQILRKEQLLPIVTSKSAEEVVAVDYLFEPSVAFIVEELLPKSVKIQFYKAVLESNASEHGARMTAMNQATENAGEMLKELKLTYNRTRQAAITKEILEIVGGAEALAG